MSEKCEEFVSGYPLRVAGGFPCPYPAKFTMDSPDHSSISGRKRVCGIHRRVLLREHWVEVQP